MFDEAARAAWAYVERETQPSTGLVNSVSQYPYATIWDMASGLAALFCAGELGLVEREEHDRRMRRMLRALNEMALFDRAAFNKNYSTRTGRMAGRNDRDTQNGYGWSATDIGRLLVWLRIIAENEPRFAPLADSVARRLDYDRLVGDGYLWGEDVWRGKRRRYMEGMIPYEQYAAAGFAFWGHRAERALSLAENAAPAEVLGIAVITDRRGHGRLTSEPLVLAGLELGWGPEMRQLSQAVLAAQEARWRGTGQVTVASEDAIPQRPWYFYYYTILGNNQPFRVEAMDSRVRLNGPRWVSAKGAYAWHALLPSDYTRRAVGAVAPARHPVRGWSSGVYERSGRSTGAENVNTAAVILEAALFHARGGRPLVERAPEVEVRPVAPVAAPAPAPAAPVRAENEEAREEEDAAVEETPRPAPRPARREEAGAASSARSFAPREVPKPAEPAAPAVDTLLENPLIDVSLPPPFEAPERGAPPLP